MALNGVVVTSPESWLTALCSGVWVKLGCILCSGLSGPQTTVDLDSVSSEVGGVGNTELLGARPGAAPSMARPDGPRSSPDLKVADEQPSLHLHGPCPVRAVPRRLQFLKQCIFVLINLAATYSSFTCVCLWVFYTDSVISLPIHFGSLYWPGLLEQYPVSGSLVLFLFF